MTLFTFNVQQYSIDYTNCSLVRSLNLSAVLLSVCVVCKINVIASIMSIIGKTCLRIGAYLILKHEKEKRRAYERRVIDVEHGSLTPLVFSACGGMGPSAKVTYSLIAAKLSEKRGLQYHTTINWIRCVLGFSLTKSAIRCIRGSRSNYRSPRIDTASIDLIMHDATPH